MKINRRRLFLGAAASGISAATTTQGQSGTIPATGRRFTGEALAQIAFPLGGIGTGTVSLGGLGNLRDWEIFNRPNKGGVLPFTFAALRLSGTGMKPLVRVIERRPLPPFTGASGVPRETALGLPRFREAVFIGTYPFAHIRFIDPKLLVTVWLEAFNPMAPLQTDISSYPVAVLTYGIRSRATVSLDTALVFSVMNPAGYDGVTSLRGRRAPCFGQNLNEFRSVAGGSGLFMTSKKYPPDSPRYGSLAVLTDHRECTYRLEWEHGEWWDEFQKWWDELLTVGRFPNRTSKPSAEGATEYASIACHFVLKPGEQKTVNIILGWHFPNVENYWASREEERSKVLRNHYGTRWPSAWEPAVEVLENLSSFRERSRRYCDSLYSSTLPASVIDAVSSQASVLRTNTVMVLEGKRTLAFEGCNDHAGCCPMNCTHVFNYEQTMAHLYPDLERSMRETDFLVNMRPDGSMGFRTAVPLRPGGTTAFPAADGQMGCVMKVYREWLLGAGDDWLRKLWPQVKRALEYAWQAWDADRDGVMEGEQHNTYDIEFYGPNTMTGTLYLGALAAAAHMATYLGDTTTAAEYQRLSQEGSARLDKLLWNGEYYIQKVNEKGRRADRYQYGEGCLSDQLLGQWFAEVVDIGKLLPPEHIRKALQSIFQYNFRSSFADFTNTQRLYALNDERGLLLCSWPHGGRPALPFVYSDEVWTGIEYQVAAHLFYEGLVKEGVTIVDAVRDRYDGVRRNPWDEIECGHHYARAMSSWSLLTSLSGFAWSAPEKKLRFQPRVHTEDFRCLFVTGTAWGTYIQQKVAAGQQVEIKVEEGVLELAALQVPLLARTARVSLDAAAEVQGADLVIRPRKTLRLSTGDKLTVSIG
jgi:uncharacterized protein (DUF608 family)